MFAIVNYETRFVVCSLHICRNDENRYIIDYKTHQYTISKGSNYIEKTNWYSGVNVADCNVQIINERQFDLLVSECEKIMKSKSLLNTTLSTLFKKQKPIIDNVITDVDFEN